MRQRCTRMWITGLVVSILALVAVPYGASRAADVVLNEYNAVDDDRLLDGGLKEDPFWGPRLGNGNDWIELVVVTDHLDMRDWEIVVVNDTGALEEESFSLTLTDHIVWSDLRSGTLITISEEYGNNIGDYHPIVGGWWLNVRASPESDGTFVEVECISPSCAPALANWKVSNKNSQITIKDDSGTTIFGPAGEGIFPLGGVGGDEVFKLEAGAGPTTHPLSAYNDGTTSTFGGPNLWDGGASMQDFSVLRAVAPYTPLTSVVINEVFSHSDPGTDWVELHNTTDSPVDVSGWYISDSFADLMEFEIPASTIIPAKGYLVFDQTELGFGFSSSLGDEVLLSEASGAALTGARDWMQFGPIESNVSFGRFPNDTGKTFRMASATQGAANAKPRVGPVVLNELMYHPADPPLPSGLVPEFIELHNITDTTVDLFTDYSGHGLEPWSLSGGADFTFSTSTSIGPRGYLVVVNFDPATEATKLSEFRTEYGIDATVAIVGPYSGSLNDFSDRVNLRKPDTPEPGPFVPQVIIDEVTYFDFGDWPSAADGGGASLERISGLRETAKEHINWAANSGATGTPGHPNSVTPQCSDGVDNDLDGDTDFGSDTSCIVPQWFEAPACDDGLDNDGDTDTDFPADSSCAAPWWPFESTACSDGIDNDGDELIDAADPGCPTPSQLLETTPACGLGAELVLLVPLFWAFQSARRSRSR